MRTVAVAFALLSVLALLPPSVNAANECVPPSANTAATAFCVPIPLAKPAGGLPETPYWDTYYLWIGPGPCSAAPAGPICRGTPAAEGSGVPLPTEGAIGAGVFGVLWKETNSVTGLQRQPVFSGSIKPADAMVLV